MNKAVKVLNFFSSILFAMILLLVYAYLPISVDLNIDEIGNIHKHQFFYYSIVIFIVYNLLLRVIFHFGLKGAIDQLSSWFQLLIFCLNVYFTFLIGFVGVWNNATHVSPQGYAYLNYLGPILLASWFFGLAYNLFIINRSIS